jgi:hypothetical protein
MHDFIREETRHFLEEPTHNGDRLALGIIFNLIATALDACTLQVVAVPSTVAGDIKFLQTDSNTIIRNTTYFFVDRGTSITLKITLQQAWRDELYLPG